MHLPTVLAAAILAFIPSSFAFTNGTFIPAYLCSLKDLGMGSPQSLGNVIPLFQEDDAMALIAGYHHKNAAPYTAQNLCTASLVGTPMMGGTGMGTGMHPTSAGMGTGMHPTSSMGMHPTSSMMSHPPMSSASHPTSMLMTSVHPPTSAHPTSAAAATSAALPPMPAVGHFRRFVGDDHFNAASPNGIGAGVMGAGMGAGHGASTNGNGMAAAAAGGNGNGGLTAQFMVSTVDPAQALVGLIVWIQTTDPAKPERIGKIVEPGLNMVNYPYHGCGGVGGTIVHKNALNDEAAVKSQSAPFTWKAPANAKTGGMVQVRGICITQGPNMSGGFGKFAVNIPVPGLA
ncbi:hypothetical protein HDU76_003978 [Blyttiomyces sp. JEL0837]|nr:hypothetical protein HDU76_003978 [Blyttiomyces sp. JEL0837]